jgi:hypothetical protein
MSRQLVTPDSSVSFALCVPQIAASPGVVLTSASSQCMPSRSVRCVWRSMKPGQQRRRSQVDELRPGRRVQALGDRVMRSPSTRTAAGAITAPPRPSTRRAARTIVTEGAAVPRRVLCTRARSWRPPRRRIVSDRRVGGPHAAAYGALDRGGKPGVGPVPGEVEPRTSLTGPGAAPRARASRRRCLRLALDERARDDGVRHRRKVGALAPRRRRPPARRSAWARCGRPRSR